MKFIVCLSIVATFVSCKTSSSKLQNTTEATETCSDVADGSASADGWSQFFRKKFNRVVQLRLTSISSSNVDNKVNAEACSRMISLKKFLSDPRVQAIKGFSVRMSLNPKKDESTKPSLFMGYPTVTSYGSMAALYFEPTKSIDENLAVLLPAVPLLERVSKFQDKVKTVYGVTYVELKGLPENVTKNFDDAFKFVEKTEKDFLDTDLVDKMKKAISFIRPFKEMHINFSNQGYNGPLDVFSPNYSGENEELDPQLMVTATLGNIEAFKTKLTGFIKFREPVAALKNEFKSKYNLELRFALDLTAERIQKFRERFAELVNLVTESEVKLIGVVLKSSGAPEFSQAGGTYMIISDTYDVAQVKAALEQMHELQK